VLLFSLLLTFSLRVPGNLRNGSARVEDAGGEEVALVLVCGNGFGSKKMSGEALGMFELAS
jgi:hypothetical protein